MSSVVAGRLIEHNGELLRSPCGRVVFTHRTVPCSKARFFRLGSDPRFSYLLPTRLRSGKYALDVKVLDRAYNAGRMAVPFNVK